MRRENQKFEGVLTDRELYLVEDGLNALKAINPEKEKQADKVIMKLYKFWEV